MHHLDTVQRNIILEFGTVCNAELYNHSGDRWVTAHEPTLVREADVTTVGGVVNLLRLATRSCAHLTPRGECSLEQRISGYSLTAYFGMHCRGGMYNITLLLWYVIGYRILSPCTNFIPKLTWVIICHNDHHQSREIAICVETTWTTRRSTRVIGITKMHNDRATGRRWEQFNSIKSTQTPCGNRIVGKGASFFLQRKNSFSEGGGGSGLFCTHPFPALVQP